MQNKQPARPLFRSASIARTESRLLPPVAPPTNPPLRCLQDPHEAPTQETRSSQVLQFEQRSTPPPNEPQLAILPVEKPATQTRTPLEQVPPPSSSPLLQSPRQRLIVNSSRLPTLPQSQKIIKPAYTTPPSSFVNTQHPQERKLQSPTVPTPEPEPEHVERTEKTRLTVQTARKSYNGHPKTKTNGMGDPTIHRTSSSSSTNELRIGNGRSTKGMASWRIEQRARDEEEKAKRWSTITIAGDNIGAYMEFNPLHGHKNPHGDGDGSTRNKSRIEGMKPGEQEAKEATNVAKTMSIGAVANSNVQSINNSVVIGSTCEHGSPGVHITLRKRQAKFHHPTRPCPW